MYFSILTGFLVVVLEVADVSAIWCYRCNSATPGCGEVFNWKGIGFLGDQCPEDDDICVKLIERVGARQFYTRDCLSSLRGLRKDIPSDTYEGCKSAAKDPHLGNYVFNNVKEVDVYRSSYDNVTFCFCFLDHRCNGAASSNVVLQFVFICWGILHVLYNIITKF